MAINERHKDEMIISNSLFRIIRYQANRWKNYKREPFRNDPIINFTATCYF